MYKFLGGQILTMYNLYSSYSLHKFFPHHIFNQIRFDNISEKFDIFLQVQLVCVIPSCMLQNDFNHVMHTIRNWPEIKSCKWDVQSFYIRSIGLLVTSTDIEEIKIILKNIFTVAFSREHGLNSVKVPNPCQVSKIYLKERICNHTVGESYDLFQSNDEQNDAEEEQITITSENLIFQEFKNIYTVCLNNFMDTHSSGDNSNTHHNPCIARKLLDFCKLLPCWSAVMVPIFQYGDIIESRPTPRSMYNEIKHQIFQHNAQPHVDEFILDHVCFITGSMDVYFNKFN